MWMKKKMLNEIQNKFFPGIHLTFFVHVGIVHVKNLFLISCSFRIPSLTSKTTQRFGKHRCWLCSSYEWSFDSIHKLIKKKNSKK